MNNRSLKRQFDYDLTYMHMAEDMAMLSYAQRSKVGAIIVSPSDQIIAQGYNGTPSGFDNCCEVPAYSYGPSLYCKERGHAERCERMHQSCEGCNSAVKHAIGLETKPEVLHAESNAIAKCAMSSNSTLGATLYVTTSPCFDCAKLIVQSGIKRVVFKEMYRKKAGIVLMLRSGIIVEHIVNDLTLEGLSIDLTNDDVLNYNEDVINEQMLYHKVI